MKKLRNIIFTLAVIALFFVNPGFPVLVLAEDIAPTETPFVEQTVTPTPSESPLVESLAQESASPSVEASPSPTAEPEIAIDNETGIINDVESEAVTGNNLVETSTAPSSCPTSSPEASQCKEGVQSEESQICGTEPSPSPTSSPLVGETGDAVSQTEVVNSVNTTEVNSQVLFQTLNIYVSGDINLLANPLVLADDIFNKKNNQDEEVNIAVLNTENYVFLSNDIVSEANTGNNAVSGSGGATLTTGDAYSLVSLLNKVNTSIVGSTIHIVTINIYGDVIGNIVLPEYGSGEGGCCGEIQTITNEASVDNKIMSQAVSGQNEITTSGDGEVNLITGNASSAVNVINIVNSSLIGVTFSKLFINVFGTWDGDFLGWNEYGYIGGGSSLGLNGISGDGGDGSCSDCSVNASINNSAYIENNIISLATSGNNNIDLAGGSGNTNLRTGNTYSSVSLVNIVNSSIINSFGFFGFVNIFGNFKGNIGGSSEFEEEMPKVQEEVDSEETEGGQDPVRESGGLLTIKQSNNVGEYVYPGDTITFFLDIGNFGTGKVYDSVWSINLFDTYGNDLGGGIFKLGEVKAGQGYKIATGLVLSKEAKPGKYTARATVKGFTGPENSVVSAFADSTFVIKSKYYVSGVLTETNDTQGEALPVGTVLGSTIEPVGGSNLVSKLTFLMFVLLALLLPARGYQHRKSIALAFLNAKEYFAPRVLKLRYYLMTFFA